ncbi:MAG: sensor histidine kinase, partial [Actinobacteria bacterium]
RAGESLAAADEPEAAEALATGGPVAGERPRTTRGISYATTAHPVGLAGAKPYGALVRHVAVQVTEAPGKMEVEFMRLAEDLLGVLCRAALRDRDGRPFSTTRTAGDGVMRIGADGRVAYASPNAVSIMRLAGAEEVAGVKAPELPGGGQGIAPVSGAGNAAAAEIEFAGRSLLYRTIALDSGAFVLVEDTTEARRRVQELKVKDATIREVHHRVKNNLQTIASLLRLQARRAGSDDARRSLSEAVERVASMAVVHDMLSAADDERVDLGAVCRTVVDQVRQGLEGENPGVSVLVEGETGPVDATVATPMALVTAELVHNAIEHGFEGKRTGLVRVTVRRLPGELHLQVRDDGAGLPDGFDAESSGNLGMAIVRTLVHDDLRGTLAFRSAHGTVVTVRVPLAG